LNIGSGKAYSTKTIRGYKEKIEEETGIDFKLKDFRSTYATLTYKHAPEMKEAISKQIVTRVPRLQRNITLAAIVKKRPSVLKTNGKNQKLNSHAYVNFLK